MKTTEEIRQAIEEIEAKDAQCPVTAHKERHTCFDVGHAFRGTYIAVLRWVLGETGALWRPGERAVSEEYSIILDYVMHQAVLVDKKPDIPFQARAQAFAMAALVERLERLVRVMEQIRDKPPASYTT